MTAVLHDSVLSVLDLVDRPGSSRQLDAALPVPDDLELPLASITAPVRVVGVIESMVEGILLRGEVHATLELSCARCLEPLHDEFTVDVIELYVDPDRAAEAPDPGYELREGRIDLDAALRDSLALALPLSPHCVEDCRGLCPVCGVNRNHEDCSCEDQATDDRWSALEGLRLPAGPDDTA